MHLAEHLPVHLFFEPIESIRGEIEFGLESRDKFTNARLIERLILLMPRPESRRKETRQTNAKHDQQAATKRRHATPLMSPGHPKDARCKHEHSHGGTRHTLIRAQNRVRDCERDEIGQTPYDQPTSRQQSQRCPKLAPPPQRGHGQ